MPIQELLRGKNIRIQDAAQLCALQQGFQHLRSKSPSLRLASSLVEMVLFTFALAGRGQLQLTSLVT